MISGYDISICTSACCLRVCRLAPVARLVAEWGAGWSGRAGNLNLRFQIRFLSYPVAFFIICCILLWFVKLQSCSSFVETWWAAPPPRPTLAPEIAPVFREPLLVNCMCTVAVIWMWATPFSVVPAGLGLLHCEPRSPPNRLTCCALGVLQAVVCTWLYAFVIIILC